MALVLTPFNFAWMMATNPAPPAGCARSHRRLDIWWSLLALLALPMALGLTLSHRWPASPRRSEAARHLQPVALLAFIAVGWSASGAAQRADPAAARHRDPAQRARPALGWLCALAFRVAERDRRAIMIEGGHAELRARARHHRGDVSIATSAWSSSPALGHLAHRVGLTLALAGG
jgi:BASS family bile acid:Na+ symporter